MQVNDDMSRAYFILLNVMLVVNYAFDKRKFVPIIFSILGLLFLISMGTRGPVVITLVFIAAKVFQLSMKNQKGYILLILMFLLIWFVNTSNWNTFLVLLQGVLESIGLSTRVVDIAVRGETLTYYSERDEIALLLMQKIYERPLVGWGVYGEWQFIGWSAHNLYLELLVNYGVIIGGLIIVWMVYINIKAFVVSKSVSVRGCVLLFFCFALVRGIWGGGFLTSPTFLMIGFCLQVCRKTNFKYLD